MKVDLKTYVPKPNRCYTAIFTIDETNNGNEYVFYFYLGDHIYNAHTLKNFKYMVDTKSIKINEFAKVSPEDFGVAQINLKVLSSYPFKDWPNIIERLRKIPFLT